MAISSGAMKVHPHMLDDADLRLYLEDGDPCPECYNRWRGRLRENADSWYGITLDCGECGAAYPPGYQEGEEW